MYQVLYQRGIGTQCSLFYIGWAHYYDSASAFKQAESVYNLGFQAKAQPFRDLEEAHKNFRLSIAQRMLYDDSQSKKRTVSQLTDQRQQITALKPVPASPMSSPMNNTNGNGNGGGEDGAAVAVPPAKRFRSERAILSEPSVEDGADDSATPLYDPHNSEEGHDAESNNGYSGMSFNTTTSTASAISSSLNSVYGVGDQTTANYSYDGLDETVRHEHEDPTFIMNSTIALSDIEEDNIEGVKIPPNFVRYARNHDEPWMGALFLDEPDANKVCKYQRGLVYPGTGVEYSPEEIRARKYASLIGNIMERQRQAAAEKENEQLRVRYEQEQAMRVAEEQQMKAEQERVRLEKQQQMKVNE